MAHGELMSMSMCIHAYDEYEYTWGAYGHGHMAVGT